MTTHSHPSDHEASHPRRGGGPRFRVLTPGEGAEAAPLPHSLEAEAHLLGCLLLEETRDTMAACQAVHMRAEWFYEAKHGTVFDAIAALYRASQPTDTACVAEHLRESGQLDRIGGVPFLAQLGTAIPTTAQAAFFIARVRDLAAQRATIRAADKLRAEVAANTGGGEQLAAQLELFQAWLARTQEMLRSGQATMQEAARASYQRTLDKLAGSPDRSRWLFTGLKAFDETFGAFDANNEDWLVVVGAFQGGAKSSFMRCLLLHNLRAGKTAQIFLLETGLGKLLELLACTAADIPSGALTQLPRDLEAKFRTALDEMHGYLGKTLFVIDEVIPVESVVARIDDHARRHGPADLLAVDHMHLLASVKNFGKRDAEMGHIAKTLARCGKRHNRTVFALAQLNREARKDGQNKRPEPHNLRDSGEIEQAARRILLLHTPDTDTRGQEQTKNQDQVMMELYQAKHNNGRSGWREVWFRRSTTKFFDLGDTSHAPARIAPAAPPPRPYGNTPRTKAEWRTVAAQS